MPEVSTFRLYIMRVLYLLIFVGQGVIQWPTILHHTNTLSFWHGIGSSMLLAMAMLAGLGLRYPLQMIPLLLFELAWKATWLLSIALPLWLHHQMDPDNLQEAPSIMAGVIVPIVIPWTYVFARYVKQAGDRWR